MTEAKKSEIDERTVLLIAGAAAVLVTVAYVASSWPVLVWSTLNGHPRLMAPGRAVAGVVQWLHGGLHADPREVHAWRSYRELLPSKGVWLALDAVLVAGVLTVATGVWANVDRWRGRRWVARREWDPRSKLEPRSWAAPRDLVHLQPRGSETTGRARRALATAERATYRQRGISEPAGGDSWPLGRLRGRELRSAPELHLMVVAPTRAGKTTRVVIPAAREHRGPAIVLSNKVDVVTETLASRTNRGPVWIYAPMSGPIAGRTSNGWTPLHGCADWDYALRMGRWMFDADPASSAAADQSGGARFYNREAVSALLPPLLHAAALGDRTMADVLGWVRGGVDALDEPRQLLADHDALRAADQLAGVQALDDRPRSLLMMSAAQLVDVYRFPSAQESDRADFEAAALLRDGGTLYLIAPESEQDALAPLFGGVLGGVLRAWESAAATGRPPPLLKILADEAAQLAPLAKLPTYLAVSGGWGVRWCLVYQSLSQLQHRYGREADAVLANALAKLFLGPIHDEPTRRYLAELLDEETITARSRSEPGLGRTDSAATTTHERQRSKVSPQRLMQLAPGEAIVVHGRDLPALTKLPAYWERPRR